MKLRTSLVGDDLVKCLIIFSRKSGGADSEYGEIMRACMVVEWKKPFYSHQSSLMVLSPKKACMFNKFGAGPKSFLITLLSRVEVRSTSI